MARHYPADIPGCMSALWAEDLGPGTYRFVDPVYAAPNPPQASTAAPEPAEDPESLI